MGVSLLTSALLFTGVAKADVSVSNVGPTGGNRVAISDGKIITSNWDRGYYGDWDDYRFGWY